MGRKLVSFNKRSFGTPDGDVMILLRMNCSYGTKTKQPLVSNRILLLYKEISFVSASNA
jgi:hypothetical protein